MIVLRRVDPLKCMHRWYSVHVQSTLLDNWSVVCTWGSLRSNFQRQRAIPCNSEVDANQKAQQIVDRKLRRGYKLKFRKI
jgi:predicted DNA-binding WGR domain protein